MRSAIIAALLFIFASSVMAQSKSVPAAAAVSYDGEAVVIEQSDTMIRYNADGTGDQNLHMRMKIQSEAGARQFSVLSFPYASANESAQIQSLRVVHSDGTSTETPASDAMDMPAPVTQQAPLYSDLKQLQIPVRGLRIGDTLEYRALIQRKSAESPSQFWGNFSFLKDAVVLAQSLTLDVPADKYVQVWSPKLKPTTSESAGRRVYQWSGSQLRPTHSAKKKDGDPPDPPEDKKPLMAWTTFHTWEEVGDWYRDLAASRAVATDALRSQADTITRQAITPEEQVRALYTFVATRIRYVGIDFGVGRSQPHAAAEVFANQYGDCKDKDTLLEAMLRAKGFASAPALIGVNIDMVPELPSPGLFNHVITTVTLPSGKLWMDTTAEVAPFQLLLSPLRDKEALVIPSSGLAAIERTPAQTPFPFTDRFEATAELKADGVLNGHVEIDVRSDDELVVRMLARNIAPAQWDQGTQYLANLFGFSGTTSNSSFSPADDTGAPMHVSYDYQKKPFGDWDNLRIVPLFPITILPAAPEEQPSDEIDLGAVRTTTSISRIRLPENFGADLPEAIHVKTPFATYDKTYKLKGGELIAEKTLVVLQSKLPAASWQQYKKFAKDISLGDEAWIQLSNWSATGAGPHPTVAEYNPAAARLVKEAVDLFRAKDWAASLNKLDEAKRIQPEQPFLWSSYASLDVIHNQPGEMMKHCRHELELHPGENNVALWCAGNFHLYGNNDEARRMLTVTFRNDPSQVKVALLLATLQADNDLPGAIATLRRASEAVPNDQSIRDFLAEYLVRNHQPGEAVALAKRLEDPDSPSALNTSAYTLAQASTDLPLAEENARKALNLLEADTATASIGEANAQSFQRTSLLVATWDTLGFILLEENKLDEAADYLEAAWRNQNSRAAGGHYARLHEARGDTKAALYFYELARGVYEPYKPSPLIPELDENIARLKKAGVVSTVNGSAIQIMQEARSFKVKLKSAPDSYCSATFRLQLAAGTTVSVMRVGGSPKLELATETIQQLHLPHLVPAHSSARILRDAVLSCSERQSVCLFALMPLGDIKAEHVGD